MMSNWKKIVSFLLMLALLLPLSLKGVSASPQEQLSPPSLSAQSAVLMEAQSGKLLLAHNEGQRLPMASITKVMTALVALEMASKDTLITVSPQAVGVEGSSIYLLEGEELTLEQLLYAVLLESANDAATAVAIGLCGSVDAFAQEMNRRTESMGLNDTHFSNPHGLDHEEHYTPAADFASIVRCALENDLLQTILSTRKATIPYDGQENGRVLINHNKLLRMYEGCTGVKTGFTKRSGRCLVSSAQRNGVTLIAVTLNAPNDWADHTAMLDYGFSMYSSRLLCNAGEHLLPLPLVGGKESYVMVSNFEECRRTLPNRAGTVLCTVELPRFVFAPMHAEEQVGALVFSCDTDGDGCAEEIARVPLFTCHNAEQRQNKRTLWQRICAFFKSIF